MVTSKTRNVALLAVHVALAALLVACGPGSDEAPSADTKPVKDAGETTATEKAQTDAAPSRAVISERLPYMELEDQLVYGHFVVPSDMVEPLPAVVLVHEWWGLNEFVKKAAERLAAQGYIVFAVDLFSGQTTDSPAKARLLASSVIENPEAALANMRAAYDMVKETAGAPRVGIVGWGMGGGLSLDAAAAFGDDIDAVVNYYGQVDTDEDALRPITAPLLAHYGSEDKRVSKDSQTAFEESLTRLRKNYELESYPGIGSAFTNPSGSNFNRKASQAAWRKTLEFLDLHLSVASAEDAS